MRDELDGLPEFIDRYKLTGLLGRGGMGRVVRAHDPKLKRDVALKLVEPTSVDPEDLEELRYLFHREARASGNLRHPNIIEVYDYSGPDAELMYLACELIDGSTIGDVLSQRKGPLTARVTASLGYELCSALQTAHDAGIIHRDLKPDNVFWLSSGRIVLSDFGIAKALGNSTARLGNTVQFGQTNVYGSPAYMAPEQLNEGKVDLRADLYALGTILFECLTGKHAFEGNDLGQVVDNVIHGRRSLRVIPHAASASLTRLIEKLLEVDQEKRPSSAREVQEHLRGVLDELEVGDPRPWLVDLGSLDDIEEEGIETLVSETTELFGDSSDTIRIHRDRIRPRQSRGPFIFAMVTVALGLAIGMTLISGLSTFPSIGNVFQDNSGAMDQPIEDIFLKIQFPGKTRVTIDGHAMGDFTESVRFGMTEGPHTVVLENSHGRLEKEVFLVSGTEPVFAFYAEDFTPVTGSEASP